jgi:hypothetical protein
MVMSTAKLSNGPTDIKHLNTYSGNVWPTLCVPRVTKGFRYVKICNQHHGEESFLKSWRLLSWSIIFPPPLRNPEIPYRVQRNPSLSQTWRSHDGECEDCNPLVCDAVYFSKHSYTEVRGVASQTTKISKPPLNHILSQWIRSCSRSLWNVDIHLPNHTLSSSNKTGNVRIK